MLILKSLLRSGKDPKDFYSTKRGSNCPVFWRSETLKQDRNKAAGLPRKEKAGAGLPRFKIRPHKILVRKNDSVKGQLRKLEGEGNEAASATHVLLLRLPERGCKRAGVDGATCCEVPSADFSRR